MYFRSFLRPTIIINHALPRVYLQAVQHLMVSYDCIVKWQCGYSAILFKHVFIYITYDKLFDAKNALIISEF